MVVQAEAGRPRAGTNLMTRCDRNNLFVFIMIYSLGIGARRAQGVLFNNNGASGRPIVGLVDGQFCDNLTVSMNSSAFPHNLDPAHLLATSVMLRDGAKYPFWIHCYLNTSAALSVSTSTSSISVGVGDSGAHSSTYSFSNLTSTDLAEAANSQQTNVTLHHPDLAIRDDRYQYLLQVAQRCEPHLLQRCQSFRLGLLSQESDRCPSCGSGDSNCDNVHHCTSDCGQIRSVNYPFNYGNNHRCRWSIRAPHTYYVNLSIIDFDIPSSNKTELGTCIFDYLTLIDGYTGKRLGCYCNENLPPPFIVSPWNELIIQFDTNSETTGRGFYVQYEFMRIELGAAIRRQLSPAPAPADTNDSVPHAACLGGWQYFRGSCYRAFNELEPLQWYDAEKRCNAHGKGLDGHLVSILDKDEMLVIHYLMTNVWRSARYRDYYIGLIDVSREGVYRWSDNNPMSYTDWELRPMLLEEEATPAQPDGGAYEDCTIIKYSSFSRTSNWHDVPCSLGKHYHSSMVERQAANQGLRDYVNSYICKSDSISLGSKVRLPLFSNEFMPVLVHIEHLSKHLTPAGGGGGGGAGNRPGANRTLGGSPLNGSGILAMLDDNRYFVCDNSEVISVVLRCDGVPHCRDGSDESNGCDQYCLDWQFKCANGRCISIGAYCNFVDDCGDGSDESRCERHRCKLNEFRCQNGQCIQAQQRCDLLPDCSDSSDEGKLCTFGSNCNSASTFQCYNGNCIPQYAVCDFQIDCPGKFHEDEDVLTCELILRARSLDYKFYSSAVNYANNASPVAYYPQANQALTNGWSRQNLFKCTSGNMIDRALRCLYEFDKYGYQIGCRDVTHLIDCASFECPRDYVKCSSSYCIPWRYICDGKWDCVMGDDEVGCARYVCPGQYKCANQSSCILLHQLCDGHRQCPMGDDEWFCDLQCPSQCDCIGHSVQCTGRNLTSLPAGNYISKSVRKLDLSHNALGPNLSTCDFGAYHHLGELILHHNGIRVLIPRKFHQLRNLYKLDLSNNQIHSVKRGAFAGLRRVTQLLLESNPELDTLEPEAFLGLSSLQMLNISSSRIQALRKNTFDGLTSLRHLLLRNNMILEIEDGALRTLSSLVSLDMRGNEIRSFTKSVFTDLKSLRNLSTDSFKFCCLVAHQIPSDRCLPLPDEISDCEDLLSSVPQSTCIWIAGLVAFVGNSIVIVWRYRDVKNLKADQPANKREVGQVNSTLLLSLGCADLLMGIYLLLIAIVDSWYRGRYIENSDNWRDSFLCKLCGFLSTVSIEVSVFTLVFIAYNRWTEICLEKPDHRFKLTPFCYLRLVVFSWILALTIATLPLVIEPYFKGQFYARSGVCLAFHITNQKAAGWLYSIIVFQGFYLLAFCIIVTCYRLMYIKISEEARKFGTEQPNHQVKIVLILIVSFAAWSPTIILRLMSFAGIALPAAVYSWIAVLVLPVNSAINPMIYTIPSIRHQIHLLIRNYRARKSAHHHGVATAAAVAAAVAAQQQQQQQQGANGGLGQQQPPKKEALPLLEVSSWARRPLDQRNTPPGYQPIKQYLDSRRASRMSAQGLLALALEIVRDIEAKQAEGRLYKSLNLDSVFVSDQLRLNKSTPPLSLFLADHEDYEPLRKCNGHHQVTGRHAHCECANVHRFGELLNELIEHYRRRRHSSASPPTTRDRILPL